MLILIFSSIVIFFALRCIYLIVYKSKHKLLKKNSKTLIVIGSGGHTTEMVKQVKNLNPKLYEPRLYVMAEEDTSSEPKILELEGQLQKLSKSQYEIVKIPRSRAVSQSYFTSVFTTIYSTLKSIPIVFAFKPDLVLCNGPGTCIPVCMIAFLLNTLLFFKTRIVFIESICRVKSLSLSGKILLYFADVVIVQWANLQKIYQKTVFLGRLV